MFSLIYILFFQIELNNRYNWMQSNNTNNTVNNKNGIKAGHFAFNNDRNRDVLQVGRQYGILTEN